MRVSSASTRAPYSVFNACSSARSALTSSAAPATTGIRASASSAAMGLKLNMDFLLPKPTNTRANSGVELLVDQRKDGGARERNAEKARCGSWETASPSGAASGVTVTAKPTGGVPPTAFCIEANDTHSPQSWVCVGVACGLVLKCVLACTTMPSWANSSASDSTCTNQRRLRRIREASAGEYSRKRRHRQAPLVASCSAVMQPLRL